MTTAPLRQGFTWWCYADRGVEPAALLAGAARIGYQAVDLLGEPLWTVAREHGLRIAAIKGHGIRMGLNRLENAVGIEAEIRSNLTKAAEWDIPVLICFVGNRAGLDNDRGLANCAATLSRLAPMAADAGVTLAVELFNSKVDHPDYQGDHTSFGVRLCEQVDSPAVRVLYDIYHMQIMDGDIIRTIREHGRWFCHYHTAGVPGRGQPDASQELNYPAIYRAIAETGYGGYVSHEFIPVGDPLDALARAVCGRASLTRRGDRHFFMDPLLHLLQHDAFASRDDLATQLNTTLEDVNQKIAAYEESGVILGYSTVIDTEKVGDQFVTAVIEVKITPERGGGFDRLAERIAKFSQVQSCYLMSGGYDLLVVRGREEPARSGGVRERTVEFAGRRDRHGNAFPAQGVQGKRHRPRARRCADAAGGVAVAGFRRVSGLARTF